MPPPVPCGAMLPGGTGGMPVGLCEMLGACATDGCMSPKDWGAMMPPPCIGAAAGNVFVGGSAPRGAGACGAGKPPYGPVEPIGPVGRACGAMTGVLDAAPTLASTVPGLIALLGGEAGCAAGSPPPIGARVCGAGAIIPPPVGGSGAPTLPSTVPGIMALPGCAAGCGVAYRGSVGSPPVIGGRVCGAGAIMLPPVAGIPAGMTGVPDAAPTLPSTVPGIVALPVAGMAAGARVASQGAVADGCAPPCGASLLMFRDPRKSRDCPGLVAAQYRRDAPSRDGRAM
jgi:hypothetical protein